MKSSRLSYQGSPCQSERLLSGYDPFTVGRILPFTVVLILTGGISFVNETMENFLILGLNINATSHPFLSPKSPHTP